MAGPSHPRAMAPKTPGSTRTAPPQMPESWWGTPRMLAYLAFDATGLIYLLVGLHVIYMLYALGQGPEVWDAAVARLSHWSYLAFHALSLVSVIFVGVRFFRLFPKAQPPRIGPMKPPPGPVIAAGLYAAWIGVTLVFSLILAGGLF